MKYFTHVPCWYTHCCPWICSQVLAFWQGGSHWEKKVANNKGVERSGGGWSLGQLVQNFSTMDPLLVLNYTNEFSLKPVVPHRSLTLFTAEMSVLLIEVVSGWAASISQTWRGEQDEILKPNALTFLWRAVLQLWPLNIKRLKTVSKSKHKKKAGSSLGNYIAYEKSGLLCMSNLNQKKKRTIK